MATSAAADVHIDAIVAAAAVAVKLAGADTVIVRDRAACQLSDAIVEAVRVASVGRDYTNLPSV